MQKPKTTLKTLGLGRETLRLLANDQLRAAAGGDAAQPPDADGKPVSRYHLEG